MKIEDLDSGPHQLYRHFDADGELLYVGISLSAVVRLAAHRSSSAWFNKIARIDIVSLPSRAAALSAEWSAIQTENPKHNISGKPGARPAASAAPLSFDEIRPDELYDSSVAARYLNIKSHEIIDLLNSRKITFTEVIVPQAYIKFTGKQILAGAKRLGLLTEPVKVSNNG